MTGSVVIEDIYPYQYSEYLEEFPTTFPVFWSNVVSYGATYHPSHHRVALAAAIYRSKKLQTVVDLVSIASVYSPLRTRANYLDALHIAAERNKYELKNAVFMTFGDAIWEGLTETSKVGKSRLNTLGIPSHRIITSQEATKQPTCYNSADELKIASDYALNNAASWTHICPVQRVARTLVISANLGLVPNRIIAYDSALGPRTFRDFMIDHYYLMIDPTARSVFSPMRWISRYQRSKKRQS